MARKQWQTQLDALRRDNRSGAQEVAAQALALLSDAIGESVPSGLDGYREWLLRTSRELVAAQPAMGILFRLVNDMLWACADAQSAERVQQLALDYLQTYRERAERALSALTEHAGSVLGRFTTVMTYSRSSSVVRALAAMGASRRKPRVICGEGRPMLEGQTLASELGWAGLEVLLGIDMALFQWLPDCQALVIGADSVSVDGLVNKVGTCALVRAARQSDIPRICLCTTHKFLPGDYALDRQPVLGAPEEIMPVSGDWIAVRNVYYDVTPLGDLSFVIAETGTLTIEELRRQLSEVRTYPDLRGR